MPIYEYRCNHCGNELEAIQKLSESPLTFCPACETDGLKKRISAAVFRLRGGGWYETDFKSDKKKNVAGDDDGASKETDNGKDKAQQQAKPDSGSEKFAKDGKSENKAKDKSNSDSKPGASGASSSE